MTDDETTKGDGETWEDYAHRLEQRIKNQREHLDAISRLDGHRRRDTEKIATLERLVGRKSLTIDRHREAVFALAAKVKSMFSLHQVQELVALTNGGDYAIIGDVVPQEVWDDLHERGLVSTHSHAPGDDPETGSTAKGIEFVVAAISGTPQDPLSGLTVPEWKYQRLLVAVRWYADEETWHFFRIQDDRGAVARGALKAVAKGAGDGLPPDYEALLKLERVVRVTHGNPSGMTPERKALVRCDECVALIDIDEARRG